ncbi:MAG: AbrB/MazE/SpoVT family DNA-binding domain-containing protein [Nitratireductor sp.]|nr:AbrB/MazE/SpoVT family DNA-binding domain-containing protein [Nitratireductor sp.]
MGNERHVKLFRNGRNQAVRIPVEFELPGKDAIMRREGGRLIIEPAARKESFSEWLARQEPFPDFPDLDEGTSPPEPVEL